LLVAFGETSISTCNNDLPRKQPPCWATPPNLYIGSTSIMVPRPVHLSGNSTVVLLTGKAALVPTLFFAHYKQASASRKFKLLLTSFSPTVNKFVACLFFLAHCWSCHIASSG